MTGQGRAGGQGRSNGTGQGMAHSTIILSSFLFNFFLALVLKVCKLKGQWKHTILEKRGRSFASYSLDPVARYNAVACIQGSLYGVIP